MSAELVERIQKAQSEDPVAQTALIERYHRPAQRVAQNILGNRFDADDAVQDAWILAFRNLHTLQEPNHFATWFYRIVANVSLRRRQQISATAAHLAQFDEALHLSQEQPTTIPFLDLLPLAMHALSNKDHVVTVLHYFCGIPVATMAQLLGIPPGTVKSRLHHARQHIRKELLTMTSSTTKRPEHIPTDFRKTIMGLQGDIPWQPIFTGAFQGWLADRKPITAGQTPAHWEPVGNDGVMGEEHGEGSRLTYGNGTTRDLEFSLLATAFSGGNIQLLFRADEENNRWYTLDLLFGWQAVAINRSQPNPDGSLAFDRLSVVNYPLEHQREYAISVAVRGHSITSYIDGALVNQLTDAPWLNGKVGLNVWHSKTLFRDIKIRHLS